MHHREIAPNAAETILSLSEGEVPEFVMRRAHERTLTPIMRALNSDLLSDDTTRRSRADRAIQKLGFI